jgi:uncharacterized protein (UPF0147 family)
MYEVITVSSTSTSTEQPKDEAKDMPQGRKFVKHMVYDNEAKIRQALMVLTRIMNDPSIPRNIRRAAMFAIRALNEKKLSPGVRAANAIGILDEVSQDPNMPLHARTLLWSAISILETVKD